MSENTRTGLLTQTQEFPALLERIAEKVHQKWYEERTAEGWTYGLRRNDTLRQTPCLVPYGELPEAEKDYDRGTARCVIEALQDENFVISRRNE